jgi:hypothetical protein
MVAAGSVLRDELIPALEYATYALGWRHAPTLLAAIEAAGHRVRDRELFVDLHRGRFEGAPIAVRTIGWDRAFEAEIAKRLDGSIERERIIHASALDPSMRGADLTFVELPEFRARPFLEAGWRMMPKRVAHVETLADDPPLVRRVSREIERRGWSCAATRDPRALHAFVERIYRPFVAARHGARARPTPEAVLQLVLLRGRLLEVRDGSEVVGGALIAPGLLDPDRLQIAIIGARDVEDEVARTAPVVFARRIARGEGYARCDHLGSPPFLDDGVFRRKRRYGTVPEDMAERKDRVMVDVGTELGRAFVSRHPFFVLDHGQLRSIVEVAC